jgi:hypothetical protein
LKAGGFGMGRRKRLRHPDPKTQSESADDPSPALVGTLSPFEGERERERGPMSIPRSSPM